MSRCLNSLTKFCLQAFALAATVVAGSALAQGPANQVTVPLPPMGWSSWNSFSNTVNSQVIMAQAKAMISTGLHQAGYQYTNIDEGWWLGERDKDGNIVVDPKAWPAIAAGEQAGDMANIVRFIHSQDLKAGIYTDAGLDGCSTVGPDLGPSYPNTGSEGHYEQDFLQFAKWGFDYVKVDWCGGDKEHLNAATQYAAIAQAIAKAEAATGHRLYFSICNWGNQDPWKWAPGVGGAVADIWRTGGDIVAPIVANTKNADRKAEFKEVLREFDQAQHPEAQHTGFYNDPDMMVVGMAGLTEQQNRAHMSLWAISGGPLLLGADLTKLTVADLTTLTNADVLRIDQDSLGLQSVKVAEAAPGLEVWAKTLSTSGERAVLLLNRTAAPAPIAVRFSDLGLREDSPASVRDVWAQSDLGELSASYSATVPAGDVAMLLVLGSEGAMTAYFPEEPKLADAKPAEPKKEPTSGQSLPAAKNPPVKFAGVTSRFPVARMRIAYSNPDRAPRFAELRINGGIATRIAFPPTGKDATGTVSIESHLDTNGAKNILTFAFPSDPGPAIQSISLQ
jgi:Alpha galactosidase A/Alpha galactosidase C-terminal beta sandwich domain